MRILRAFLSKNSLFDIYIYIKILLNATNLNVRCFMYLKTLESLSDRKILKRFSCDCSLKKVFYNTLGSSRPRSKHW